MNPQADAEHSAIETRGLCKSFIDGAPPALDQITTSLKAGTITGLVGPDGAGKTTLLRLMAGLLKPTSGSIRILGLDPAASGTPLRESVGYMPQQFGLYEDLTVRENLTLYAELRQLPRQEIETSFQRLLQFTRLEPFQSRPAGKLSGGMKQKLGLACTLLGTPKVLLLDEPGVGVDPIARLELWDIVRTLAVQGMTIVWSTAYLDEAQLCDDVRLMNAGTLAASGPPAELLEPMRGRSLLLTDIRGNRRKVLRQILRAPEVIDGVIQGQNVRIVLRDSNQRPDLSQIEGESACRLLEVKPRLEDAFISLLGGGPGGDSVLAAVVPEIPKTAGKTVIEARDLTRRFGDFIATDSVSFSVKQGEIFGLLGPNGAGKSTTFKMECGLLEPSSGRALVMGIDLKKSPQQARQQLGYMAQKFSLYKQLTVSQNLTFFSGIYGLSRSWQQKKIQQMIEVFDLAPHLDSMAGELALGFKQRLALACAMMHEPQVLFLDEPTSGVDPITRREFWSHINGLAEKGVTILVTTHFMDEAEYCDRIGLVYQGKMIAQGSPDELKRLAITPAQPNPSMEQAFIHIIKAEEQ